MRCAKQQGIEGVVVRKRRLERASSNRRRRASRDESRLHVERYAHAKAKHVMHDAETLLRVEASFAREIRTEAEMRFAIESLRIAADRLRRNVRIGVVDHAIGV